MDGVLVGLTAVVLGGALLWLAWIGSQRRLAPNRWVGVRTRSTRRSDAAWYAAHEAAAAPLGLGGGIAAFCGVGIIVNGLDVIGWALVAIAAVASLVGLAVATSAALRAARTAPG